MSCKCHKSHESCASQVSGFELALCKGVPCPSELAEVLHDCSQVRRNLCEPYVDTMLYGTVDFLVCFTALPMFSVQKLKC